MPDVLVEAHELTRSFGSRSAVQELSLTIHAGEIVALLGPNGAGKTTTLRMIAGLIAPDSGRVRLRGQVGLLTESPGLWDSLSVQLNLLTHARLHRVARPRARVQEVLAAVSLSDRAQDRAGYLSKGLRQRVAIARALLHNPAVLLLDEPTSGLDPESARQVRDLIVEMARQQRAVLISTHNLTEAETLAHRIGILNVQLRALDSPASLRSRLQGTHVDIDVEGDASRWEAALQIRIGARTSAQGSRISVAIDDQRRVADVVALLVGAGARIVRVHPDSRTLEDVYLEMVKPT